MSEEFTEKTFVPILVPEISPPILRLEDQPKHRGGVGSYVKSIGNNDNVGVFTVARCTQLSGDFTDRCDYGKVGPVGWHEWDETKKVCSCGSKQMPDLSLRDHVQSMPTIKWTDIVFDGAPYGYICYFEHFDPDLDEIVRRDNQTSALTLQEIFVTMLEWDWAWENGSTNPIAECCHGMLSVMEMPDSVREWLIGNVSAQRVKKFLRGDSDANARGSRSPWFPPEYDDWVSHLIIDRPRGYGKGIANA
jgi:hypothetical protein